MFQDSFVSGVAAEKEDIHEVSGLFPTCDIT